MADISNELHTVLLNLAPCVVRPHDKRWLACVVHTADGLHAAVQRHAAGEEPGGDVVWATDVSLDVGRIRRERLQMILGPLAPRELERMAWLIHRQARMDRWLADCAAACS